MDGFGWIPARQLVDDPTGNQTFGGWPGLAEICLSALART
jgi:hypothetical protein